MKLASASAGNFDAETILSKTRELEATLNQEMADRQILSSRVDQLVGNLNLFTQELDGLKKEASQATLLAKLDLSLTAEGDLAPDKNLVLYKDLDVLGKITTQDLTVGGKLSVGLLTIESFEDGVSIKTLSGNLKLQDKVTIDTEGSVITEASMSAQKYNVKSGDVSAASAGKVEIAAGETQVEISTTAVSSDSLIFVTAENLPVALSASFKEEGKFTIRLEKAQDEALKVSWWVVN
ncbi:hypothetical protein CO015_00325 [candidate division WWE3 bacterium CG_4_8_14_3_um_filter_42_11]|uniref:Uncharacterized protein n=2 Tax=Katanobacteria TaxID=422282 RepID=A0A2M7TB77_UNCKA|nr:MAG: hypothetical protein COY34_02985 [candidate division WWE3 bacterium CG_4_10_14_0_2_um_filter_42_8]PJC69425.1 MAG: hypothetical protein CO015_00325 [candidate division WWE3 bacterium CG_4_8_14_3_um_filter_42_11]